MSLMHIFANNIKRYRIEKELNQESLADIASLHSSYISAVERERRNIFINNIENIASALKVEPYLFFMPIIEGKKQMALSLKRIDFYICNCYPIFKYIDKLRYGVAATNESICFLIALAV